MCILYRMAEINSGEIQLGLTNNQKTINQVNIIPNGLTNNQKRQAAKGEEAVEVLKALQAVEAAKALEAAEKVKVAEATEAFEAERKAQDNAFHKFHKMANMGTLQEHEFPEYYQGLHPAEIRIKRLHESLELQKKKANNSLLKIKQSKTLFL